jgi:hypothetical protein
LITCVVVMPYIVAAVRFSGRTKQFWVTLTPRIASNSVIAADSPSLMDSGVNHSSYGINCTKHWRSCCTFLSNGFPPSAQPVSWSGRPNATALFTQFHRSSCATECFWDLPTEKKYNLERCLR